MHIRWMLIASHKSSTNRALPFHGWLPWLVFAVAASFVLAVLMIASGYYARQSAFDSLIDQGHTDASLKTALLQAVLERPRALPLLLAEDQQLIAALTSPGNQPLLQALDGKLERLVTNSSASVLYLTGPDGVAVASSNWREPLSFVGNDYSFRDYFRQAVLAGTAEHFALGNVSKRPGLYISRRVEGDGRFIGVVVVKMEFDRLERDWSESGRPTFVTDQDGVVLITSVPSWRFSTVDKIAPERIASIKQSLQYGDAPLTRLPIRTLEAIATDASIVRAVFPGQSGAEYLKLSVPIATTPWRLQYLLPTEATVTSATREARLLAFAFFTPFAGLAGFLLRRRQVLAMRIADEKIVREELERRVAARTEDLSQARDRLQAEIADHRATETRLQVVQQELVQANRLAILGQVAAGVAHEINQPVATIRAYADNARTFLSRKQQKAADENLGEIAALTERIGTITEELKAFGRKGRTPAGAVDLRSAIEGAVILLRSRFAGHIEALKISLPPPGFMVKGTRVRIEQVLINLFQNALEALEGRPDARVEVTVEDRGDLAIIRVSDNGPGIDSDIRDSLFSPFNTSKEKGLGLGLVISKDIVSDYGGRIELEESECGATFAVYLCRIES
ncbi:sensor histidine kinase [Oryzifoliimicrobium ureilyticus]|uniref:sensor histidine kinase n=1 Tax=Oryzifoliimicrobium ureilyticus TaxID=3113724 RepID=UPI003F6682D2